MRQLLHWQDQGLLRYDGLARDVLLELHAATSGIGSSIDRLLAEYAARQDARVEAIEREAEAQHRQVDEFRAHYEAADVGSICEYFSLVVDRAGAARRFRTKGSN